MNIPTQALQSLGTEFALTSFRRARIAQGHEKIAMGVPSIHTPPPGMAARVAPKLPGGKSPTAPMRIGQDPTVRVGKTVNPPKTASDELGEALAAVLG